jgi:threonine aldolase
VFVPLPDPVSRALTDRGWAFHTVGDPAWRTARFMASFDTSPDRVDRLLADALGAS